MYEALFRDGNKLNKSDGFAEDVVASSTETVVGKMAANGNDSIRSQLLPRETSSSSKHEDMSEQDSRRIGSNSKGTSDLIFNSLGRADHSALSYKWEKETTGNLVFERLDSGNSSSDKFSPFSDGSGSIGNLQRCSDSGYQDIAREYNSSLCDSGKRFHTVNGLCQVNELPNTFRDNAVTMPSLKLKCIKENENQANKPLLDLETSFKMPAVPVPRLSVNELISSQKCGKENAVFKEPQSTVLNTSTMKESVKPFLSMSPQINEFKMKRKIANEALKATSYSTMKKSRTIRIKKTRYKVLSILGKGGSSKVGASLYLSISSKIRGAVA